MDVNTERSSKDITQQYFALKGTEVPAVLKVVAALKKQNDLTHFIPGFAKKEGYAVWDKSTVHQQAAATYNRNGELEQGETLVFTPIVQTDSNFVNGFFFSRIVGDSTELHLYRANDYDLYPYGKADSNVVTAELVTNILLQLNEEIFGHRKYKLLDSSLFYNPRYSSKYRTIELDTSTGSGFELGGKKLPGTFICYYTPSSICTCGGDGCSTCLAFTCYTTTPTTGGTGTGGPTAGGYTWPPDPEIPGPGGGGSGGNNDPPTTGNCTGSNECGQLRSLVVEGRVPCGGCGPGPVIAIPPEVPSFDELWMNQSINDSTNNSCVAGVLNTLRSISSKLPSLMRSVFDTSQIGNFNMTLKLSNLGPYEGGNTEINFINNNFKVKINSYYSGATNLSVVSTIIHETMHCQLMDWFRRAFYENDTILRNNLALKYGYLFSKETTDYNNHLAAIVWGSQGASQHQDIAVRYRNAVGEAIYEYAIAKGISNITLEYCQDLAWSGCQSSKAFLDLNFTVQDNLNEIINAEKDPFGTSVNTSLKIPKGTSCL